MNDDSLFKLWVYLSATPLAGLTVTLAAYCIAYAIYVRARLHPFANPVLISVIIIVTLLEATRTNYTAYFDGAQFVHFLLGPAVVGLAVPLAREWPNVRKLALPVAGALAVGAVVAIASAVGCAYALGASPSILSALATKSVTAPIAMGIAENIGGVPALAAVFSVATGIIGAALGKFVLDAVGARDRRARGFALGLAAHGIGTARAFQVDAVAGAYASLAFGLHGALAALALPYAWRWVAGLNG
ncbi:MAG: LrgB family protein [Betaproteobacteria bacterium]